MLASTISYWFFLTFFSDDFKNAKDNKWFNSYIAVSPSQDHSFDYECILCKAATNGHLGLVKYLLRNGANVHGKNKYGQSPILLAALNGYYPVVKYLYHRGAGFHYPKFQNVTPHSRIL